MKFLPLIILGLLPAAATAATAAPDLDKTAGVYKSHFKNGTVDGDKYTSEDVFELVKVSSTTAYFRIHSEFYNGHECNLSGIADLMADSLTYFGPKGYGSEGPCVLKFKAKAGGLAVEDVDGGCRAQACGARGGFDSSDQIAFKTTARRPIRYMPRLLASAEYKDAVKEHAAHPVGTPAPSN